MVAKSFSGGAALEKKMREIASRLTKPRTLKVGFLENATYPDGTSVAMVAAIQEFGAPAVGIPPRPFFRTMIAAKSGEWGPALGGLIKEDDYDPKTALETMGEGIKGQLQQSIIDLTEPALSPVTLMLRKMRSENQGLVVTGKTVGEAAARVKAGESTAGVSTKPLEDSAHMLNSVDSEVSE